MNIKKSLDEGFENLEKGLAQQAKATVKAVVGQAGVSQGKQSQASDQGSNEAAVQAAQHAQQAAIQSDEATREEVAAFYAPSDPNEQHGLSPQGTGEASFGDAQDKKVPTDFFKKQIEEGKTPEEAAKLEALRQKLHAEEYYVPLTERKLADEEQEEEKKEEEQEKMEELQVKEEKKKSDDEVIKQSQQKTEKFPGASG